MKAVDGYYLPACFISIQMGLLLHLMTGAPQYRSQMVWFKVVNRTNLCWHVVCGPSLHQTLVMYCICWTLLNEVKMFLFTEIGQIPANKFIYSNYLKISK